MNATGRPPVLRAQSASGAPCARGVRRDPRPGPRFVAWYNALGLAEDAIPVPFAVAIGVAGGAGVIRRAEVSGAYGRVAAREPGAEPFE